jgi:hypothetical protein
MKHPVHTSQPAYKLLSRRGKAKATRRADYFTSQLTYTVVKLKATE